MRFRKAKPQRRQPVADIGRPKPAFSYYAGDTLQTKKDSVKSRKKEERHQVMWKRLRSVPSLTAIGIILVSAVYSTTISTAATVKFAGDQSSYRTLEDYRSSINKILDSSVWNKSKLTINTFKTEKAILANFPELDAVNVALPVIGRRPTIILHARKAAVLVSTRSKVYVLDMTGKVVAESNQLPSIQRDKLLSVDDKSGLELHVGSQAVTTSTITFILNIQAQLRDKKLEITQIVLPVAPNEVDLYIKDLKYFIKTDATGDARMQIGGFLAAKENGTQPVEYMDVRVEEKVFYK